jgi:hypothetical protein
MPHAAKPDGSGTEASLGAPVRLGALDLEAHLRDPTRKQAFVTPMFDVIAPRYDDFTRLFSFGMDAGWKRDAIAAAVAEWPDADWPDAERCGRSTMPRAAFAPRSPASGNR